MNEIAIRIEKLGKMYRIGRTQRRYDTLRDRIAGGLTGLLHHLRDAKFERHHSETVWALKDVSLEIKRGEVLGIIGRNGAGKSTLLKILSGITEPTEGRIEIHGRIGSLLEVGTGFHPELTGRDNIYLNGAILGMKRNEIRDKFDQILAFAEVERFIDTPIKHYSSGMYLRLAFAVAAHLEPEILLVDEVLAVGDYAFQKKCLNEMDNVARSGRTVLFVSHNMAAINSLCGRVILLDRGMAVKDGQSTEVTQAYLNQNGTMACEKVWSETEAPRNRSFRVIAIRLKNGMGDLVSEINISEEASVEIEYEVLCEGTRPFFSLTLFDANGFCVFSSHSNTPANDFQEKLPMVGHYVTSCCFYGSLLNNGRYHISMTCTSEYWTEGFTVDKVISFDAIDDGILRGNYQGRFGGVIRPKLKWSTIILDTSPVAGKGHSS